MVEANLVQEIREEQELLGVVDVEARVVAGENNPIVLEVVLQERGEGARAPGQEDAEALNDKGTRTYNDGRIEEAIELFKRALELAPDVGKYHVNLGVAYGELEGKDDDALACYRKAAELDRQDPSPHLLIGYILNESGDPDAARREWEEVTKLAPGTAEAKEAQDAIASLERL